MKPISTNKKAYRNYHISQVWECGLALQGAEVKSVREGSVSFTDTFAREDKGEVFLYNLHINPYKQASYMNDNPDRPRKLLMHKREIKKMASMMNEKGMALIPTKIYFNKRGFVKVELGLGKGKKLFDKREDVKKRVVDRALKRAVKVSR